MPGWRCPAQLGSGGAPASRTRRRDDGMSLLAGKRALVTGGSRGIGAAIVRAIMGEGGDVAFTYRRSAQEAEELARELTSLYPGQRCFPVECDVADTLA